MAIPNAQLDLTITNTMLALMGTRPAIRSTYRVIAPNFDALIAEISYDQYVDELNAFEDGDAITFARAQTWFDMVKEWHEGRNFLDGYSYHDASLCLAWWTFEKPGNLWTITHPVSGEFTNIQISVSDGKPKLKGRVAAVLDSVSPPPTWSWAESASPEQITVHCIAVPGADSYNVYTDLGNGSFTYLGNVPDHTPNNISVSAGTYNVRMAAVDGGVIGVMGNANLVTVAASGGSAPEVFSVPTSTARPPVAPPKSNRLVEWIRRKK